MCMRVCVRVCVCVHVCVCNPGYQMHKHSYDRYFIPELHLRFGVLDWLFLGFFIDNLETKVFNIVYIFILLFYFIY